MISEPNAVAEPNGAEPAAPRPRHPGRAVAAAVFTVFAGPPLGALPFYGILLYGLVSSAAQPATAGDGLVAWFQVMLFVTVYAYLVGGLQAAAAGLMVGLRTYRKGTVTYGETILIALIASALGGIAMLVLIAASRPPDYEGQFSLTVMLGALSILSALLCRMIAGWVGIFPRARKEGPRV